LYAPLKTQLRRLYWLVSHRIEDGRDADGVYFHQNYKRAVHFSFDDGPRENQTAIVSRLLAERGVQGTFFMEGWRILAFPEIVREVDAAGHLIGNHTFSHRFERPGFTPTRIAGEIVRGQRALDQVLRDRYPRGYPHRLFRPPEGFPWSRDGTRDERRKIRRVLAGLGFRLVLWQIDSGDWNWPENPDAILNSCSRQIEAGAGGVILFHDSHPALAPAVGKLIDYCRDRSVKISDFYSLVGPSAASNGAAP
jgi:peptidoglycan/xylan/chitin deacetylase (PgdA/CDA1 family)